MPQNEGNIRMSQTMENFMKKLHGDRLKKMMQDGIRASRFTRLSNNMGARLL